MEPGKVIYVSRRRLLKGMAAFAGLAASGAMLEGCVPAPPAVPGTTPVAAPTTAGAGGPAGTLRIAMRETILTLDPQAEFQIVGLGFINKNLSDTLVMYDEEYNFVPGLALSWSNPDDLTWEFKLREGVAFHNGEPFNAEAAKFSLDRQRNPELQFARAFLLSEIAEVEVADEYTVLVHTTEPFGALLPNLTLVPMVPPQAAQGEDFANNPVGTGPFKFVEHQRGERLVLEAYPEYWGGAPGLQQVIYYPIAEDATRVAAARTGDVDIAYGVPPEDIPALEGEPHLDVFNVLSNDQVGMYVYLEGDAPRTDPVVRQAMMMAIDRQKIIDQILQGVGAPATSIVSPALPFFNPDLPPYPFDPERARALLAEAGYQDGFSTNVVVPSGFYPKDAEITQAIGQYLMEVGISLEVRLLEQSSAWPLRREPYEFFYAGNAVINMDGDFAMYRDFTPETSREKYNNPEVTRLLTEAKASTDQERRRELYQQAQALIWQDLPILPIHAIGDVWAVNNRVQNWQPRPDKTVVLKNVSVQG